MTDKYYIPSIKEFYSGFEHEFYYNGKWNFSNEFSNDYDYEDNPHYMVQKKIDKAEIRVKYLDNEDIESLGFEFTELFGFKGKDYCIIPQYNDIRGDHIYEICLFLSPKIIVFNGRIRNKSELKILLRQLNINH